MSATYITFVDTETTGLDYLTHEIIELAAIKTVINYSDSVKTITIIDQVSCKVKPTKPVDPFVAKINHYTKEEWEHDSVELHIGLEKVFELMKGTWHAGSNPAFDARFLKVAADSFNWSYPNLASYHLLDTSNLGFKLFLEGKVIKLKQEALAEYFNLGKTNHRALDDAFQCMQIFTKLYSLNLINTYRA